MIGADPTKNTKNTRGKTRGNTQIDKKQSHMC